jgi:hypothetical protein
MEIVSVIHNPQSMTLTVSCSGAFGVGSRGNVSGDLIARTVKGWIAANSKQQLAVIEVDYTRVEYVWDDGPISSLVVFFQQGIQRFRLIAGPSNCNSLKNLLESCRIPGFEFVRKEEVEGQRVITPVALTLHVRVSLDHKRLVAAPPEPPPTAATRAQTTRRRR